MEPGAIGTSPVAPASKAVGAYPNGPDRWDRLFAGVELFGGNVGLLAVVLVEGVDIPFLQGRSSQAFSSGAENIRKRKALRITTAIATDDTRFQNATIALQIEDTNRLLFSKIYDLPPSHLAARKSRNLKAGMQTTWPAFNIPWTDYGVLANEILQEIQYHLLCTADLGVSWDLWTQAEVLNRINERLRHFMMVTGIVVQRAFFLSGSTGTSVLSLTPMLRILRVAYEVADPAVLPAFSYINKRILQPSDQLQADLLFPDWQTSSTSPFAYIQEPQRPSEITIVPSMPVNSRVEILFVPFPSEVTASAVSLPIPNIFTPFLKWGVIADLLSKEGEANDPQRAAFAESLYQLGISLAQAMQTGELS